MDGATLGRLTLGVVVAAGFLSSALIVEAKPTPSTNATVTVDENDSRLYCEKTNRYDICWFAFSNYALHALSVRSLPGENTYSTTAFKLCCLLIPYTGLRRGLCLLSRASNFAENDLQCAARANALCMIIRTAEWRPRDGDTIAGCRIDIVDSVGDDAFLRKKQSGILQRMRTFETMKSMKSAKSNKSAGKDASVGVETLQRSDSIVVRNAWRYRNHLKLEIKDLYHRPPCQNIIEKIARVSIETYRFSTQNPTDATVNHEHIKLQGFCDLAPGYALCYIPADMKVYPRHTAGVTGWASDAIDKTPRSEKSLETHIASAHNVPRVIFSIGQTVSGGYALYKARGPQIEQYGFAAFGLTVIPYLLISVINFFGALFTSEYETIFLVHSSIMDEMIERGGRSDGAVGTVHPPTRGTLEINCNKREERVEDSPKSIIFEEEDNVLRCHDISEPRTPQTYQIFPYEPPIEKMKKQPRRGFRSRFFRFLRFMSWPRPGKKKKKKKDSPQKMATSTISIPSHSAFTRLRRPNYQIFIDLFCLGLLVMAILAPYLIIWLLSGFKVNRSTSVQRNLTLNWLICGQAHGYFVGDVERLTKRTSALKGLLLTFLFYGSYFVGGFIIVAEEMVESGDCKALG